MTLSKFNNLQPITYEADIYFWGNYDDALRVSTAGSGSDRGPAGWQGQPVRAGLERADRRREVSAGPDADFNARREVLRRNAQPGGQEGGVAGGAAGDRGSGEDDAGENGQDGRRPDINLTAFIL